MLGLRVGKDLATNFTDLLSHLIITKFLASYSPVHL